MIIQFGNLPWRYLGSKFRKEFSTGEAHIQGGFIPLSPPESNWWPNITVAFAVLLMIG